MEDVINNAFNVDVFSYVMLDEFEIFIPEEVCNIARVARNEIVDRRDPVTFSEKFVT